MRLTLLPLAGMLLRSLTYCGRKEGSKDAHMASGTFEPMVSELRAMMALADANTSHSAAEEVDIVYNLAGSSSIFAASRIQRCFQDVHLITQHVAASSRGFTTAGRYLLGLPAGQGS